MRITSIRYENATPQAVVDAVERALREPLDVKLEPIMVGGKIAHPERHILVGLKALVNADRVVDLLGTEAQIKAMNRALDLLPTVYHVVDVFRGAARHHVAQATWAAAYAEGMIPVHVNRYVRDARKEMGDPRALPYLKDLLRAGLDFAENVAQQPNPDDLLVWTNSDIGFKAGIVEFLRANVAPGQAASMRRTESNGQPHLGRDLFVFTRAWLESHFSEMPDYVIGAPTFDLGLVAMIRKHAGLSTHTTKKNMEQDWPPADLTPGYALHESHDSEWNVANVDSIPSVFWNKTRFRSWAKKYSPETKFTKGGSLL